MNWFIAVWNNCWPLWDYTAHVKHEFFAEWATQMNCWIFWLYLEGKAAGIDGAISQRCGEAEAMPISEFFFHTPPRILFRQLYVIAVEICFKSHFDCWNYYHGDFGLLFHMQRAFRHIKMAHFARADSASCLHCNSEWGLQRSVIESPASCTLCTALFHPHVLIYTSRQLFSALANHPPPSN